MKTFALLVIQPAKSGLTPPASSAKYDLTMIGHTVRKTLSTRPL